MQIAAILWHVSLLAPPGRRALALGLVGLVRLLPNIIVSLGARRSAGAGCEPAGAGCELARDWRGPPVRVRAADHSLDDAAGFFRDVLLVGYGPAADFRAGHSACGRARLWLALRSAGDRCRAHEP